MLCGGVKVFGLQRSGRHLLKSVLFCSGFVILVITCSFVTNLTSNFQEIFVTSEKNDKFHFLVRFADETEVGFHQFKTVISNDDVCHGDITDPLFIIVVYSRPNNEAQRQQVRRTWGEQSLLARLRAILVFALAVPQFPSQQKALIKENSEYHDIIQFDYLESYENLTYKTIASVGWVSQQCANARMFMKIDDDVQIKVSRMVDVLERIAKKSDGNTLFCNLRRDDVPFRNRESKWYISEDLYPFPLYPDFCSGPFYMIPVTLTADFYKQALRTRFFKLEDVFLTGIVRHSLRKQIVPLNDMYCDCYSLEENKCVFCH